MFIEGSRIKYKNTWNNTWSSGGTVVSCPERHKFIDSPDKVWAIWDDLGSEPYHISITQNQVELMNPIDVGDLEDDL